MAENTGIGLPGEMEDSVMLALRDNEVPMRAPGARNLLVGTGFSLDTNTQTLMSSSSQNFSTDGEIQAGTNSILLAQAHRISSSAENVVFTNEVTGNVFHPTWQTTTRTGPWSSLQRTPTSNLVMDEALQAINTEDITNPIFMLGGSETLIDENTRIYDFTIEPESNQNEVTVLVEQDNGDEFVPYWSSRPFSITGGADQRIILLPFVDVFANTEYRVTISSTLGDVVLKGDTNGIPRILTSFRRWEDRPLITSQDVGDFRINGLVEITADVTITADNVATYQNKLWIIQGGQNPNVTVSDDIDLTYFGFYANPARGRFTIQRTSDGATTFDGMARERFRQGRGSFFVRIADNTFVEIEDTPLTSTFLELNDTAGSFGNAGDVPTVNAARNALGFAHPNQWDHVVLTAGQMAANNRRWYTYSGVTSITIQLPVESGISEGWHAFIGNDSVTATITLEGNFRGDVSSINIRPQHGCVIGYDGTVYLEGAGRTQISVSNLPNWPDSPLIGSGSYIADDGTTWNSGPSGTNLNTPAPQADMLNRLVTVQVSSVVYLIDLPSLTSANRTAIPIGSSYGFLNQGSMGVLVRPRGSQTIIFGGTTFSFANGLTLATGALAIISRVDDSSWSVTFSSGTITGGTTT